VNNSIKQTNSPAVILITGSVVCIICYSAIAILSHTEESVSVFVFLTLSAISAIASASAVLRYQQLNQQIPFIWIIGTAVLFRLIGVLGQPILEDDHHWQSLHRSPRYFFCGR
jgi:hypothetical protein